MPPTLGKRKGAGHERLGADPRKIETKTGRAMVTATLAVDAADKREGVGELAAPAEEASNLRPLRKKNGRR